ncbi:MAG: hypothetical protein KDA77_21620, partial [Planctomycetaceae bacterium]|nr:hypothetical protein [Planctomycetaceae bacterium]
MAAAAQHRRQAPDRDMTAFFENTDSNQPAVTFKPVLPVNQIAGILAAIEHRFSAGRQNGIV